MEKNNKRNGVAKKYYSNGQLEKEATYKNDVLDGPAKIYNKNGQLESEAIYKNGQQVK